MQQLRQSLLHWCTVIDRLPSTDIGTDVWSQEGFALPIWILNTVYTCPELSNPSLRQDSANMSKQVASWRREAKRARADLQLADQDTTKHGKKDDFFSMRCGIVTAL